MKPQPDSACGRILRAEILAHGFKLAEFAERIGVSRAVLDSYLRNVNNPPVPILIRIADTLDCSIDYLVGRTPAAPKV
jgi:transcriptional regulator with XRE-family HTH domain